jgi:formylglycine-generating enzyme required for sulfatase activity
MDRDTDSGPLERVFRGGNWHLASSVTRASTRSRWPQTVGAVSIGFRCVTYPQR